MQTWLEQVKADAELQTRKSLERRKLEAEVTKNRQWRSKKHRDRLAYIESFVLVEEQISRWWQALPDEQKQRPFTTRELAPQLRAAGVKRLNVSLDSLKRERFAAFTRRDKLDQVLEGIEVARAAGFARIKLNTVVQKGRNDDEVLDLVEFAMARGLDISFIEEMPLGTISSHQREQTFCSSDEVRERIEQRYALVRSSKVTGGPSRYWQVVGSDTQVGFISPHSHNFCGDCNRVRVTAEGKLVLCLGHENALDLKGLMRAHPGDSQRLSEALMQALQLKPERHHFESDAQVQVIRFMSMTGG